MSKSAQLFRMATDEHICPFGLKSKDLLEREGYTVDDQLLTSREQTDEFKKQHSVETTPQTFIDNKRFFRLVFCLVWHLVLQRIIAYYQCKPLNCL